MDRKKNRIINRLEKSDCLDKPYKSELVLDLYTRFINLDKKYPEHSKQLKVVKKHNVFLNSLCICLMALIIVACSSLVIYPIIAYLIFGEKYGVALPLYLIGLDHTKKIGYFANYAYQAFGCFLAVVGFQLIQSLNVCYTGLISCMIEILRSKVSQFEQIILIGGRNKEKRIKQAFAELVEDHIELFDVASTAEEILSYLI
uniref:CSON003214 protein n=1 Tax=Culicoides sonorensis TaxID=179676 RepID=A0A336MM48_CULSO